MDYMGGAIYPESLVQVHAEFLKGALLGNTHSESNRSVFAHLISSFIFLSLHFSVLRMGMWMERD